MSAPRLEECTSHDADGGSRMFLSTQARRPGRCHAAIALACSALLAACGAPSAPDPTPQAATPNRDGSLSIALESDFQSLDPLRVSNMVERQVALSIMDPLFDIDANGNIVPMLAESADTPDDGTTWRVKLREGVRFHDDTPLDAEAVVFNIERMRDPANACRCLPQLDNVAGVRAIDPLNVEFTMHGPDAVLPALLADAPGLMLSPTATRNDPTGIGSKPVGAGAFRLASWEPGHRIVVERNPSYWQEGKPLLQRVTFLPLPNEDSRQAALLSGDVDVIQSPHTRFSAQYGGREGYRLMTGKGLGSVFLMMNTRRPPFDDVRVRRAIAHATDRPTFVKALLQDQYPVSDSLLGPGSWAYTPVLDYPAYSPERAKALLAEVGKPVKFEISVINSPFTALSAQALQQMWRDAGIEATIRQTEGARFMADAINHDFQMSMFRFVGRADPDLNLYRAFHSRYAPPPSSNYTGYANPAMDALLEKGRATTERGKRVETYAKVSQLLAQDVPYLFLFTTTLQTMMRANVQPGPNIPDGVLRLQDASIQ
ncbi:MAG: ABC transporter substrate-binding protein [Luteimonas sp.]|nr:ABC transporter substrate-binding protein [Luteimonas sp.]